MALFVHESVPHREISINTAMQIVAVRMHLSQDMTVFSECSLNINDLSVTALNDIVTQVPLFLLLGDLKGHSRVWRCRDNNRKDGVIKELGKVV